MSTPDGAFNALAPGRTGPLPFVQVAISGVATLAVGVALGAGLGWLSWRFWVLGLGGLVLGLGVGWSLAVLTTWLGGPRRRWLVTALAIVAVLAGWAVHQTFEDAHQRQAYRVALAETRAAETGLPPAEVQRLLAAGGLDYLADDGDAVLEKQVAAGIGFGGVAGRWLFRAQGGVRLAGSWRAGRALPVGIPGVIIVTLLELAVAVFIAWRIVRRSRANDTSPAQTVN